MTGRAWWRRVLSYAVIFLPLAGVYLLPADTSLEELRRAGTLRACIPGSYPPLITGDPAAPGVDVELLRAVAAKIGVRLDLSVENAMGRDFNPRSWHITRAQCEVLAGGIVSSPVTRSFLETSPSYAQTGWAFLQPMPVADLRGRRAGVLAGATGLDRIALGRYLRAHMIEVAIVPDAASLAQGLRDQRFDMGITERLLAERIAAQEHFAIAWAPAELARYPLVFGLWKGDVTLKRAVVGALEQMQHDGETAAIIARYLRGPPAPTDS